MALTTGLVAYWKMDGNSNDATGNGHNGTDTSMSYSTTNAVIAQAGQFNGTTSKILIPDNAGFDGTTGITLSGWGFYTGANLTGPVTIISKNDAVAANGTYVRINITSSKAQGTSGGDLSSTTINGSTTLSINTRYMITMTCDSTTLSLYVNGASDATPITASHAITPGTGSVGIGVLGDINAQFWTGALDEIGWWSRALTSSEITQLYNSGNGLAYPFTTTSANSNFFNFM